MSRHGSGQCTDLPEERARGRLGACESLRWSGLHLVPVALVLGMSIRVLLVPSLRTAPWSAASVAAAPGSTPAQRNRDGLSPPALVAPALVAPALAAPALAARSLRDPFCSIAWQPPYPYHGDYPDTKLGALYPLSSETLDQLPLSGNYTSVVILMREWASGARNSSRILVFGGSETVGDHCEQRLDNGTAVEHFACAWATRFTSWLRHRFPKVQFRLQNMAVSGRTSCGHLMSLGARLQEAAREQDVDLVIFDPLINDFFNSPVKMGLCFRGIIKRVASMLPRAALFAVLLSPLPPPPSYNVEVFVAWSAGLPWADYVALQRGLASATLPARLWNGSVYGKKSPHPDGWTHQLIADMLTSSWGKAAAAFCAGRSLASVASGKQPFLDSLTSQGTTTTCAGPLSMFSAYAEIEKPAQTREPAVRVLTGDWRLVMESVGRPGWIATRPGSELRLLARFGPKPMLTVSFVRSSSDVSLRVGEKTAVLRGLWERGSNKRVSQTAVAHFTRKDLPLVPGECELSMTLLPGLNGGPSKFKLIEVISC